MNVQHLHRLVVAAKVVVSVLVASLTPSAAIAGTQFQSPGNEAINPSCLNGLITEQAKIERVTDGDTVVLSDQRRVRLIGINSAELNAPDPRLRKAAQTAKEALSDWLPSGETVTLHLGAESQDRHGRLLAHVSRDQDNLAVAQLMIQKGLAVQSAVSPNSACANHFAKLETGASNAQSGLWAVRELMSVKAAELNTDNLGFKLVNGTITSVKRQKRFTELYLDDRLRLLIRPKLAKTLPLEGMMGKRIEVRGWISRRKTQVFLWLQHPANLAQLTN